MSDKQEGNKFWAVARKELAAYFSSPTAFIFIGTFLAVSIFIFFWVERFFERNIADVRPLFEWIPLLLIFLVAALTMRMWSEERRMGTLEFLLTTPVRTVQLILGKFLACMILVGLALLLTVGVPLTVALIGQVDPGPVLGGYLAALLLAGAYCAVGLFVSSRTDNQIVSLITTILLCVLLYLPGVGLFAGLFGSGFNELLLLLGTGSRFASITRGIIDFRDLYYYFTLIGIFLALNIWSLEELRWTKGRMESRHHRWRWLSALVVLNLVAANFWLAPLSGLRVDLTSGQRYTISAATHGFLERLQEPLLIRGYFSAKTHRLLAPLVPELRDLIREYAVAGGGQVRVEFIDPREHPDLEEEANRRFGIKPVPIQVADRYQVSVVNSYFDVVVSYGDKFEVLGFRDLIELRSGSEGELEVQLRNPEYDITRSIRKVLYGFQTTDNLFAGLSQPLKFTAYFSRAERLPELLNEFTPIVAELLAEIKEQAKGNFDFTFIEPEAEGGQVAAEIAERFGFRPMVASLLDPNPFYYYMVIEGADEQVVQVPLPEDLNRESLQRAVEAALKRFAVGFLKTVGLHTPPPPMQNPYMPQMAAPGKSFNMLREFLEQDYVVKNVDLTRGLVPEDVDTLFIIAPENFGDKEVFAVDQFLMKGGTVLLAKAPFSVERSQQGINARPQTSGLEGWLEHFGVSLEPKLVMDPQNEMYPVPVQRRLGGFAVEEIRMVNYPLFVDIRGAGLSSESVITAGIPAVTLQWSSPLLLDEERIQGKQLTRLLESSAKSWASPAKLVQPDFEIHGEMGFAVDGEQQSHLLGVILAGRFESFFKGQDSPLLSPPETEPEDEAGQPEAEAEPLRPTGVIEQSSESARLLLFASNEFLADQTLQVSSVGGTGRYLNSLQMAANAVDWALEDGALLSIRSRGRFANILSPLNDGERQFFEYLNYGLLVLGLLVLWGLYRLRRRQRQTYYSRLVEA